MEFALISLLNGVTYGLLLFMLSSGLTLIFSMMSVLNFAHASFYMLGAYFAYQISGAASFWAALLLAPLLVGVLGALVERFGIRKAHRFGHVAELLFTFGLSFLAIEVVQLVWGKAAVDYRVPSTLQGTLFTLYSTSYPIYKAFMIAVSVFMLAGLYSFLTYTRIGLIIQAALSRPDMVQALGHDVPRIFTLVFAGGTALAGLAGVIGGNALVTEPGMADAVGPIVFVVVVVGGLGSLTGAFVASLLIGILQTFMVGMNYSFVDFAREIGLDIHSAPLLARLSLTQFAPVMPYLLMVAILIFRPRGLMGARET
ncbi:MAG: branched-chain amino acid ABC transporter permease [Deltaproteobacteria bacterium]|nr:MAG: branched-chain amino acid ABC transporter permease [Deltaproteobacteria bacterium]TMB26779.1 MAG: branched-chain amino acid ABC transporter permease [Deltaproteobacteria bacterium]